MFSNPFAGAFGLDIGDLSAKLVQIRNTSFLYRHPQYEVIRARSISFPPGLIVNGELAKPEEVRSRLKKLITGTGNQKAVQSPWVVASLPESRCFIKLISLRKSAAEIIDDDIIWEAKKHIPFDEDNYYLEWQVIPSEDEEIMQVLIGAAPKVLADSYTYLLESLGLGVVALEIEALSLARAMVTANKNYGHEARIIANIGATNTNLIFFDNNLVQFSTSLPFSGELLTTALAQRLHIEVEEAEEMKRQSGLNFERRESICWQIIVEQVEKLAAGITDALQFYYSHNPEANHISRLVLAGG
ncbi:MAG TPA: pilus assembly protein PilM, partial [Patescibacteria group bacterium]|nr:pilus assembly protein PilM [Patescibacteria group bacterium]